MSEPGTPPAASRRRASRGEAGLVALVVVLVALTLLTAITPELRFAALAPEIDLLINGLAALVAALAAWLSWLRQRHMVDRAAVYRAAAFVIFALTALVQTLADLGIAERELGLSLSEPRQAPVYAWSFLRLLAGGLLLRSAWLSLRPPSAHRRGAPVLLASVAAAIVVPAALYALEPMLPPLLGAEALARLVVPDSFASPLPGITLLELGLQAVAILLLGTAAWAYALAARRDLAPAGMYLSAGLVLAAFAQVHFALFPGIYSGLVTSSDVLRICFYGFVLVGIQAEAGTTLRELRTANRRLHELREVELANASLAERARLAREVHDGLAQHLWLAKLATERLTGGARAAEIDRAREDLDRLLDAGLDEARQTVAALREASSAHASLAELLARHARRFEEQTGLDTTVQLAELPTLPPRSAAELLRIAQEALNNVRRHADATLVSIELAATGDHAQLIVRDNGIGFEADADHAGFGLESMRERAMAVGGSLRVESAPSGGTTIEAQVPLPSGDGRPGAGT